MITISFEIESLFNHVIQRTVYYSKRLNQSPQEADIIPMTEDERDFFYTWLRQGANLAWEKIATFASEDVDAPFILDIDGDDASTSSQYNSLVYRLDEPTGYVGGVQNPMITNAIHDTIVSYVVSEWLRMKGYDQNWQIEWAKHLEGLARIKSALMYKNTAKLTYKTF